MELGMIGLGRMGSGGRASGITSSLRLSTGLENADATERAARGVIVATLDGDGQNNPAFLPDLISAVEKGPNVGGNGGT